MIDIIIIVMDREVFKFNKLEELLFILLKVKDLDNIFIMLMENQLKYQLIHIMVMFNSKLLMSLDLHGLTNMDIHLIVILINQTLNSKEILIA